MDEIKGTVKTLMRGFYCKVPYAYYHRLTHATLSRPTEFVRQIPVPAIKYLKKESWPVYNKYIGPSLDRAVFKHRLHIAAEPAYVVPESECQPTASTSSHPRQVREIVSKAKRRYQTKVINSHQQQEQFGYPTPVLEPRKPTAISSNLKLPGRSKSTKPSPGTAAVHCQPTSSDNSIHPLAACGASTKRKLDAVVPSVMNANKKLKAVHQASQLIATFQLAQEPKAIAASSEAGHCTVAPQATVTGTLNASASSAANKEGTYEQAAPVKRVLSATAPNTNVMEQLRNLAHAYKQRGDGEQADLVSALNHLHAFCNYIVSYYYKEKQNPDAASSESLAA
ncbi:hypothetical protein G6F69_000486 [Rhizopus microsporus]|nr:hypothetical protein G6F69_000486 [Rhizopus microsporus]